MIYITDEIIDKIIKEDMPYSDITTEMLGIGEEKGIISFYTRSEGVIAGAEIAGHFPRLPRIPRLPRRRLPRRERRARPAAQDHDPGRVHRHARPARAAGGDGDRPPPQQGTGDDGHPHHPFHGRGAAGGPRRRHAPRRSGDGRRAERDLRPQRRAGNVQPHAAGSGVYL